MDITSILFLATTTLLIALIILVLFAINLFLDLCDANRQKIFICKKYMKLSKAHVALWKRHRETQRVLRAMESYDPHNETLKAGG